MIGAGRCGTTTLCEHLAHHPDIVFSSIKEVNYFSVNDLFKRGSSYLHGFFKDPKRLWATSDTYLLSSAEAPARVAEYNTGMKLIVILRDPIERAWSSYRYAIGAGYHTDEISFEDWPAHEQRFHLSKDPVVIDNNAHFYGSLYHLHLSRWAEFFPKEQILILRTKDLQTVPASVMAAISEFLDIAPFPPLKQIHANVATGSKSKALQQFLANRNHPLRRAGRWLFKPMGSLIIKSGLVEKLKAINKAEAPLAVPLPLEMRAVMGSYFTSDLESLYSEFGIRL